jgi:hypothetical protein
VRRLTATLLLALFSISLMSAFGADPDAKLPACCRRNGKHHCAMAAGSSASPEPGFKANDKCPLYPGAALSTSVVPAIAPPAAALTAILCGGDNLLRSRHRLAIPAERLRAHLKRGPPFFSTLG